MTVITLHKVQLSLSTIAFVCVCLLIFHLIPQIRKLCLWSWRTCWVEFWRKSAPQFIHPKRSILFGQEEWMLSKNKISEKRSRTFIFGWNGPGLTQQVGCQKAGGAILGLFSRGLSTCFVVWHVGKKFSLPPCQQPDWQCETGLCFQLHKRQRCVAGFSNFISSPGASVFTHLPSPHLHPHAKINTKNVQDEI